MSTEAVALRAIEQAVASQDPVRSAPEIESAMAFANMVTSLTNQRDGLLHERALQADRIASLESEIEQQSRDFERRFAEYRVAAEQRIRSLEDLVTEVTDHATYFRTQNDEKRDALDACERIIMRAKQVTAASYPETATHKAETRDLPESMPFGAPMPRALRGAPERAGNVTPINRLKSVQM